MSSFAAAERQDSPIFAGLTVDKMPAHWLMARLGKRVLRPGGRETTEWLLGQCELGPQQDVVELAPGLGVTARRILSHSPKSYVGIERDATAVAFTSNALASAGYPAARIVSGDAANVPLPDASATLVVGEAMLSMQPESLKASIIAEARRILRRGGQYAIHELAMTPDDIQESDAVTVQRDLSKHIHVGVRIGTVSEWKRWLTEAGFTIEAVTTKPMRLLEPDRLVRDEGPLGAARFAFNVMRTPGAARRLLSLRRIFRQHQTNLCAIAVIARAI
jgi:ubiquinone/menaquinone biosynthesis C-methylase UbiE